MILVQRTHERVGHRFKDRQLNGDQSTLIQ